MVKAHETFEPAGLIKCTIKIRYKLTLSPSSLESFLRKRDKLQSFFIKKKTNKQNKMSCTLVNVNLLNYKLLSILEIIIER